MTNPAQSAEPAPLALGRPIIFVGGLHRSGTSVIHRCIAAHPGVSGFEGTGVYEDEGQHLQSVYPPAHRHGGPGRFGLDPSAHLTESSALVSAATRRALLRDWGRHWDPGSPVVVEKSPPNIVRTRFLQAVFPEAAFVLVLRHPIAVCEATRKWRRASRTALMRHWANTHHVMAADLRHLRRFRIVRYEVFVRDPESELAALFEMVGLPPIPVPGRVRQGINERYFESWRACASTALGGRDCRRAIRMFQGDAERWGYSLSQPELLAVPPPVVTV